MIRTAVALPPGANFVGTFQYCHVIWHIYEVQPVEWTEWPGGDGPPTDTYGKAVDIANVDAADSSPVWTGPAAVADWSTPCRYRFAAEQPDLPL